MKKRPNILKWPTGKLDFSSGAIVMGILNVTPDSFSDGGQFDNVEKAVSHGIEMARQEAAIIDIGPESTRPGSKPVLTDDQIARSVDVIEKLSQQIDIPISIDTTSPDVAKAAIEAGASIINDISALGNDAMAALAVEKQVPVILMHMQGTPRTMQNDPRYQDVLAEVRGWLAARCRLAGEAGVEQARLMVDPGIGFGKNLNHNLALLAGLREVAGGRPLLLGASRKRFIAAVTGAAVENRLPGSLAALACAWQGSASVVRVHDVAASVQFLEVLKAVSDR